MWVTPRIYEKQNEFCLFKIVATFKRAGNSIIQKSQRSPVLKRAGLRSAALLMTIFGETRGAAEAGSKISK